MLKVIKKQEITNQDDIEGSKDDKDYMDMQEENED